MNTNIISRVLAVIGIVALSVPVAHAGHGQGNGLASDIGYECYVVAGETTGFVVNIDSPDLAFADRTNVGVGRSRLLCIQVTVSVVSRADIPNSQVFNQLPAAGTFVLQCHDMIDTSSNNPAVIANITGSADVGTFALQGARYVCLPASISTSP